VHHHLLQGTLHLCPIAYVDQLADVFTKAHPSGLFRDLVSKFKLASTLPPWVRRGMLEYILAFTVFDLFCTLIP
jgi:hypothetical protein